MPWLRGIASGGGGSNMAIGTLKLYTSSASENTIDTGIINLTAFHAHAIKGGSSGNGAQIFIRWEVDYGDNFFALYRVSTTYGGMYTAFGTSAASDYFKIKSIDQSTGRVTLYRPSAGSWYTQLNPLTLTWWAY